MKNVKLSVLNIVTHPHSPREYVKLLKAALGLKQIIKIWGDTHAALGTAYELDDVVTGEIFTFLEIDMGQQWLDLLKGEEASNAEVRDIVIPRHLKPHFKRVRYAFFPKTHLFVFAESGAPDGNAAVSRIEEFLKKLLNDSRILAASPFPEVRVNEVHDKQTIHWMLDNLRISTLEILVKRPNGDTGGDDEDSIEEEMQDQNIGEYRIEQKAEKGKTIVPNRRTLKYMEEAALNGYVEAKGNDVNDRPVEINTRTSPLSKIFKFDSKKQSFLEFFIDSAKEIVADAIQKLK